jgi:catechol 2,3-dioxygenase-like lactoylglutathione lyase family enzyme
MKAFLRLRRSASLGRVESVLASRASVAEQPCSLSLASDCREGYLVAMPGDARVFVFDHVSVGVEDLERAARFYDACLAPLGYVQLWRNARSAGYGPEGYEAEAPFAIVASEVGAKPPGRGFHVAFVAPSREAVDRFHAEAVSQGGVDEGPPGIRENYDPGYYAAFVRDPDGHRLEAVLHER